LAVGSITRSIVRSPVRGVLSAGGSLLSSATSQLGIAPYHYWDFTIDRALFAGVAVGDLDNTPGWSFTRATVGTAEDLAGNIIQFASGEPRRTDRGLLLEATRTNLFLNSAVGVTQSVTVAAAAHTLSFRGTGTITLTGTSTAGPLVGTGVNNRVTLTFTPTAGTLTLTISGSVTNVNLEAGSFATSWIPTAGSSVIRNADVLTGSSPGVDYPLSLYAQAERAADTGAAEFFLHMDDASDNNRAGIGAATTDVGRAVMASGGVSQAGLTVAGALAVGTAYKIAGAFTTNRVQMASSGTLGTEDTVATAPATPTTIRFGINAGASSPVYGYIRRAAIFNTALTDAQLQAATA